MACRLRPSFRGSGDDVDHVHGVIKTQQLYRLGNGADSVLRHGDRRGTFLLEKSAIFIILPEEDQSKYFMVSLLIQQLYREIFVIADENGGKLKNRVMFYCDEFGTFLR